VIEWTGYKIAATEFRGESMAENQTRCVGEYIAHKADGRRVRVQKIQDVRVYDTRAGGKTLFGAVHLATHGGEIITQDDEGHYWLLADSLSVPLTFEAFAAPHQNTFPPPSVFAS
jgi:hypothetical protein